MALFVDFKCINFLGERIVNGIDGLMLAKILVKSGALLFFRDKGVAVEKEFGDSVEPGHFGVHVNEVLIHIAFLFDLFIINFLLI